MGIEYNGFLDEDLSRPKLNLHQGTMNLTQAKEWCIENPDCVGFNHRGEPSEGPHEFFFKDYWRLSVDTGDEEPWTSYQKGSQLEEEPVANETDDEDAESEITAERIMEEYGVDMEKFHKENKGREDQEL